MLSALIDLDNTLADYHSALTRDMLALRSPNEPTDFKIYHRTAPEMKERAKFIRNLPNWWLNLEPLKDGFAILDLLRKYKFDLHILTQGPNDAYNAWSEKVKWTHKHVPDAKITITQDKSIVNGNILFDDWPSYIQNWLRGRFASMVIMPAREWNADYRKYECADQIVRYDGNNINEVEERIVEYIEKTRWMR